MLINFSNHPTSYWSDKQLSMAIEKYVSVIDIEFPDVNPELNNDEVKDLAKKYVNQIINLKPSAVHIMGELNLIFECITLLKSKNISCLASTTRRIATSNDNYKTSQFEFVQFRNY